MKQVLFLLLIAAAAFSACSGNPAASDTPQTGIPKLQTHEDSLVHDVLEGHDSGMARMVKLSKYIKKTKLLLDSVATVPAAKRNREYEAGLKGLLEDLQYAEMSMNTWMEEFKLDSLKEKPRERVAYLESEKMKVTKMKEAILNSLQKGDSLLKK